MPVLASDYMFRALIIPFVILAIAAIGLNILVGYCGQISIGTAAFMAVGAYAAYNLVIRVPQLNFLIVLLLAGGIAALVGALFGIPSLRIKGLYLAVSTLAAQFSSIGCSRESSGSALLVIGFGVDCTDRTLWLDDRLAGRQIPVRVVDRHRADSGGEKSGARACRTFLDGNARHGRRAEVIGIRPLKAKLSAFAVSSFYAGVAGALWGFVHLSAWEPLAFNINLSLNLLFMIIIGGMGSLLGAYFGGIYPRVADPVESGAGRIRCSDLDRAGIAPGIHDLWRLDRLFSDRRTAWAGAPVGDRQENCGFGRSRTEEVQDGDGHH